MKITVRFNSKDMQRLYEQLVKQGYHWKTAQTKTIKIYQEHGYAI